MFAQAKQALAVRAKGIQTNRHRLAMAIKRRHLRIASDRDANRARGHGGQGMARTIIGPTRIVTASGSFCHSAIAN